MNATAIANHLLEDDLDPKEFLADVVDIRTHLVNHLQTTLGADVEVLTDSTLREPEASIHLQIDLHRPFTRSDVNNIRQRIERYLRAHQFIVIEHITDRTHNPNTHWFEPIFIPSTLAPKGWRPWWSKKITRKRFNRERRP